MGENSPALHYVSTHEEALELIGDREDFWVSHCWCRDGKEGGCARSRVDICLSFRPDTAANEKGRRHIPRLEVLDLFQESREKQLVTRPFRDDADRARTDGICFCCDDCCGYLRGGDPERCDKGASIETTDPNTCVQCGACQDVCYFGARKIEDETLKIDRNACYGCGLCVDVCPTGSIETVRR
jgi:NAD-dependent dihydropyrimidine dehydrogenase PreA subunit